MAAIGFSLNNLTLFGLVLAIGIVVDDAIVVVEAVEHHIEHGLAPREATDQGDGARSPARSSRSAWCWRRCSCRARSSRGIIGQFFRQFALTIAVSTVISAFNSLTLSPALAALLLQAARQGQRPRPLPRLGVRAARRLAGLGVPAPAWLRWRRWLMRRRAELAAAGWPLAAGGAGRARWSAGSLGRPLEPAARLVLPRCSTPASTRATGVYTAAWSAGCCGSASLVLVSTAACSS